VLVVCVIVIPADIDARLEALHHFLFLKSKKRKEERSYFAQRQKDKRQTKKKLQGPHFKQLQHFRPEVAWLAGWLTDSLAIKLTLLVSVYTDFIFLLLGSAVCVLLCAVNLLSVLY